MPIPTPNKNETEQEYVSRCISDISSEYEQDQAAAICYDTYRKENLARIPIEIVGDNEEKILEYLPDVKSNEMEDLYLARCVPFLYPEYVDDQKAYSLCADKYERIITVSDKKRTNLKSMKSKPISDFDRKRFEFQIQLALKEIREKGIDLFADKKEGGGSYPWDECIADQMDRYGDEETANKVCGYIKSEYGS